MKFDSSMPLYYQVVTSIRQRIESGELLPGEKLPSENELCALYEVSRVTVRKALSLLCQEGLVERIPSKGHFVGPMGRRTSPVENRSLHEQLLRDGITPSSEILSMTTNPPGEEIARHLQCGEEELVIAIQRVRFANAIPFALETIYLPSELFAGINPWRLESESLVRIMQKDYGIEIDYSYQSLEARLPTRRQAELLRVSPKKPQLFISSNLVDRSGRVIKHTDMLFVADVVEYSFTWNA